VKPLLIIQNHRIETPGTIADYLTERELPFDLVHPWNGDKIPSGENYRASLVLGCPLSVHDTPNVEFLKHLYFHVAETIRNNRPYLGICFGAQILAKALGATVERNPNGKEIGTFPITLTAEGQADPLFAGFPAEFPAFHWHGEMFKIPFGAKNLASSALCVNQAFRIGNAAGIQFHLEASMDKMPEWCAEYAPELVEIGTDANALTAAFQKDAETMKQLNFRLLDNFLSLV
jgi:GMP synthase-like glutamine amidotransferase